MKLDDWKMTDFLNFPAEEAEKTLEALKQAEQTNDIEALKWCARRLAWLDDTSEIDTGEADHYPVHLFNKAWAEALKNDPPPESIADIIAQIDKEEEPQTPTAAVAEKAIETVRTFFEDNMGGESFKAICVSLDELKKAVKKSEAA
jgi:hypothetical protein